MNFLNMLSKMASPQQDQPPEIFDPYGSLQQAPPIPQDQPMNFMGSPAHQIMQAAGVGAPQPAQATREQDSMAQQRGFRNYGEMLAWAKQRNAAPTHGTVAIQGATPQPEAPPPPQNPAQGGLGSIFSRITNAMRGAGR